MHPRIILFALFRQYRAKGDLFRTPREERPYGQTDKPHTVGRGLAPAESCEGTRFTNCVRTRYTPKGFPPAGRKFHTFIAAKSPPFTMKFALRASEIASR